MFVLDASVAASWLFPDEVTALSEHALDLHCLSAYDSSYLDLALRTGSALATRDDRLRRAAIDAGVTLLS